ncbi:MAG: DUF349 domain-containing protein [Bacteroidetes bacterium]|nr:DUF349 domain-containing protein [Bacteroidota bacterium]
MEKAKSIPEKDKVAKEATTKEKLTDKKDKAAKKEDTETKIKPKAKPKSEKVLTIKKASPAKDKTPKVIVPATEESVKRSTIDGTADSKSKVGDPIIDSIAKDKESDPVLESQTDSDKPAVDSKTAIKLEDPNPTVKTLTKSPEVVKEKVDVVNFEEFTRDQLLVALEEIVKETDISLIKYKVSLIKVAFLKQSKIQKDKDKSVFIKEGGDPDDFNTHSDSLDDKFKLLFDVYKQNKTRFNKSQEELKLKNLELKKEILEELKALNNSEETLKKTYDDFKLLQERWKEIGMVPQGELNNLWQNYHFLVEMFFDKVKINKELRDLDLKKNMELKIALCEKTEELLLETSIIKSFKELQDHHDQWKKIGPVPQESKEALWERFKAATDKINERRREYYSVLHEEQKKNLEAKITLCEKAEALAAIELKAINDWQSHTDKINELLKIWKSTGPAPRRNNDEIWKRFKTTLNSFFDHKKEFYSKLKEHQLINYNKKLNLCVQSEALESSTDWKKTTVELINLQKEWKTIGPVPKKYSDKIWKRFRAACDNFFNNKSDFYSNVHVREEENLKLKLDLIKKVKDYKFGDDKKQHINVFKEFQREWVEIGHVPIKDKDKVHIEYRKSIDAHLNGLQINQTEINTLNYKSKFEKLSNTPEARNMIYKERSFLTNKISKMRDDINLWENNVGFFSNSKNANILKAEFEKKIDQAKNELGLMEAKLKVINNTTIE